jgi:four helix bundle protein
MAFKFEQLRTWQLSMDLAEKINKLAEQFPPKERYNLSSQSVRSADSVSLNIAEGSTGLSDPEQIKFLRYANRSALEVVTCLFKAKKRKYIDNSTFVNLYSEYEKLSKMIQAQIASLEPVN